MRHTTVICLGAGKLTGLTRGIHNICNEITKKYQVLYITKPPEGNEMMWGVRLNLVPSITKINKRLFSLEWPCWVLRFYKIRQIDKLMTFLRYKIIICALRKLNTEDIAFLYVTHPVGFAYLPFFPKQKKIYHVFDNYSYYIEKNREMEKYEEDNLKKFDCIFYLSKKLLETKIRFNKNSYFLPHGVNFDLFSKARFSNTPIPPDVNNLKKPVIGLVGALSGKIDVDLLLYLAKRNSSWSFLLVGPELFKGSDSITFQKLCSMNNVVSVGCKPLKRLPSYMKLMDVFLMPYRITGHVKWVNPLKTYEYFATGKPVVATRLDSLEEYSKLIYFADRSQEWQRQIYNALKEQSTELELERISIARNNTWHSRMQNIYDIISQIE